MASTFASQPAPLATRGPRERPRPPLPPPAAHPTHLPLRHGRHRRHFSAGGRHRHHEHRPRHRHGTHPRNRHTPLHRRPPLRYRPPVPHRIGPHLRRRRSAGHWLRLFPRLVDRPYRRMEDHRIGRAHV